MFKILIVEDDRGIAEGIQSLLEQWGMEARQVQDFRNITGEFETYQPHLILLDIKLPSYDGYYWCRPCCGVAIGWRLPCRRRSAGERC